MKILNDGSTKNETNPSTGQIIEFAFEHAKEYQHLQFAFLDAVESLDHNNIMVKSTPYISKLLINEF